MVVGSTPNGVALYAWISSLHAASYFVGRRLQRKISKFHFEGWGQASSFKIFPLSEINPGQVSWALFCIYPSDLEGALKRYLSYLAPGCVVALIGRGALDTILHKAHTKYPQFKWRLGVPTFEPYHVSSGIHQLANTGAIYYGPHNLVSLEDSPPSSLEQKVLTADRENTLKWETDVQTRARRIWLDDTVINSFAGQHHCQIHRDLLESINGLRELFDEAYMLGCEMWGRWPKTSDQLFGELVSVISSRALHEPPIIRDLRLRQPSLNRYWAGQALEYRHYPLLMQAYQTIDKTSQSSK